MLRPTDRLIGPVRGDAEGAIAYAERHGAHDLGNVVQYVEYVFAHAQEIGLDPAIVVAQSAHETGAWGSMWWDLRRNPAGLGITGDPAQNQASPTWVNGEDAARGHLHHLGIYAGVDVLPWKPHNPRWVAAVDAGYFGVATTINDLTGRWAVDPDYAAKVAARGNAIWPDIPSQEEEEPTMTTPRILVVAGHRSTDRTGNPEETRLTPALARDYRAAFRAAGYDCWWLQEEVDGDWDPDDTAGDLDTVGQKTASWMASTAGPLLMLDLHYEGSPAPGCFAIVPDVTGLRTGVAIWQDPADTWENNSLDRRLGAAWAKQMQLHTGLRLRTGIRQPGLMDESETGVGGQGWRLAMFAYTVAHRERAVRLVLEHGNHTHPEDRAIIFRTDFTNRSAPAAVAAVAEVYGDAVGEPTTPDAPPVPYPEGMDLGIARQIWPNFAPTGDMSRLWLDVGKRRGSWGTPDPTFFGATYDSRTYWRFDDGLVLWQPNEEAPVRVLGEE